MASKFSRRTRHTHSKWNNKMFNGGSHLYSLTYFTSIKLWVSITLRKKKKKLFLKISDWKNSNTGLCSVRRLIWKFWLSIEKNETYRYHSSILTHRQSSRYSNTFDHLIVSLIKCIAKNVFNYANSRSSVDYSRLPVDICKHNGCTVNHPRSTNQRIHSLLKRFTTCCPDVFATRLFFPNRGHGDISWRHGRSSDVCIACM